MTAKEGTSAIHCWFCVACAGRVQLQDTAPNPGTPRPTGSAAGWQGTGPRAGRRCGTGRHRASFEAATGMPGRHRSRIRACPGRPNTSCPGSGDFSPRPRLHAGRGLSRREARNARPPAVRSAPGKTARPSKRIGASHRRIQVEGAPACACLRKTTSGPRPKTRCEASTARAVAAVAAAHQRRADVGKLAHENGIEGIAVRRARESLAQHGSRSSAARSAARSL